MSFTGDFVARSGLKAFAGRVVRTPVQRYVTGPLKRARNRAMPVRRLEIGPGARRIDGFETLNVVGGRQVDYVGDATRRLPFPDGAFDLIYASHILEHVAWYSAADTLREWVRALKPGGWLEIWVPDGLKIAEAFVEAEHSDSHRYEEDGWWRFNEAHDPCAWASGRLFSYGDGSGRQAHFNWHLATYSERRLRQVMADAGLVDLRRLAPEEVRGFDHGWINLGVTGRRP